MFKAKTQKIEKIAQQHQKVISELENLLKGKVRIYIDYANVRPWSVKLQWHVDTKRLKQFLDSFDNIEAINFYHGLLSGNEKSEREIRNIKKQGYSLRTKPVKIMRHSIDVSSIKSDSTVLLDQFIRRALLRLYKVETIEYLNSKFAEMNSQGTMYIEDRKCNFDVELGVDMLLDFEKGDTDTFVLWSGDSDFADPVKKLLDNKKRVIVFATSRKVSRELNLLREEGLLIFDIKKIKKFICWGRELK